LANTEETKNVIQPNTTKANIHPETEIYYNTTKKWSK